MQLGKSPGVLLSVEVATRPESSPGVLLSVQVTT